MPIRVVEESDERLPDHPRVGDSEPFCLRTEPHVEPLRDPQVDLPVVSHLSPPTLIVITDRCKMQYSCVRFVAHRSGAMYDNALHRI